MWRTRIEKEWGSEEVKMDEKKKKIATYSCASRYQEVVIEIRTDSKWSSL
jgi:hypothetical protein